MDAKYFRHKSVKAFAAVLVCSFLSPHMSVKGEKAKTTSQEVPLVKYLFSFAADEGLQDISGHGYDGIMHFEDGHGAWLDADGSPAVRFRADSDSIKVPYKAFPGNKGRMEMAVLFDSLAQKQTFWQVYTPTGDGLRLVYQEGKLRLSYYQRERRKWHHTFVTAAQTNFTVGKWHTISASWDVSNSLRIHLDGTEVASTAVDFNAYFPVDGGTMIVGNERSGGRVMQGSLRSFELWSQPVVDKNSAEAGEQIFSLKDTVALDNQYLRLLFSKDELTPVAGRHAGSGIPVICDSYFPEEMLLWRMTLRKDPIHNTSIVIDNRIESAERSFEKNHTAKGSQLRLRWSKISLPDAEAALDVDVTVELPDNSPLSYWKIEAHCNDKAWNLWQVDFPILHLAPPATDDSETYLALPYRWGLLLPDPFSLNKEDKSQRVRHFSYPANMHLQFFAIYGQGGTYIATYDPDGYQKNHQIISIPSRQRIRHEIAHFPSDRGSGVQRFELSYPFVLGTFNGDWYDACQLYRQWALEQPWCRPGPLATRNDVPEWLKNNAIVLKNSTLPGRPLRRNLSCYKRLLGEFGGPMLSMWYEWWKRDLSNTCYPNHEKPEGANVGQIVEPMDGVVDALKELETKGARPFAYINTVTYDQGKVLNEAAKPLRPAAKHDRNGNEILYNKTWFPVWRMCRVSKQWQDYYIHLCARAIKDFGFAGIYMDSFGRGSLECFDVGHGHESGGGNYAVMGQHALAQRVRDAIKTLNPEAATTAEASIEFFIDVIDIKLLHFNVIQDGCPLWPAVYHDYQLSFGRSFGGRPEQGFRVELGNLFVMGAQLGRIYAFSEEAYPFAKEEEHSLAYLTQLVNLKRKCHAFLGLGKFLRPVHITPPQPLIGNLAAKKEVKLPEVITSSWQSSDSRAAIVLVNLSRKPKDIEFEFSAVDYGFQPGVELTVTRHTSINSAETGRVRATKMKMKEHLHDSEAVVIELSPVGRSHNR